MKASSRAMCYGLFLATLSACGSQVGPSELDATPGRDDALEANDANLCAALRPFLIKEWSERAVPALNDFVETMSHDGIPMNYKDSTCLKKTSLGCLQHASWGIEGLKLSDILVTNADQITVGDDCLMQAGIDPTVPPGAPVISIQIQAHAYGTFAKASSIPAVKPDVDMTFSARLMVSSKPDLSAADGTLVMPIKIEQVGTTEVHDMTVSHCGALGWCNNLVAGKLKSNKGRIIKALDKNLDIRLLSKDIRCTMGISPPTADCSGL